MRYIDADNFRKTMIKRFGCIPCLTDYSEASKYDIPIDDALNLAPTADVVPKSEVAELLLLMFNDDCACNYNGNDEWLPFKCKFALTDCPMPKERLGCWMEFVEYGLAELKKKYTEEQV